MSNDKQKDSASHCIVGCKLPHGLKLELTNKDGVVVSYVLKGSNAARIVGGYGFTEGVPLEFMETWLKKNERHPAVINGSVFIHTSARDAEARAKEGRNIKTGLEAVNPLEDARAKGLAIDKDAEAAYRKQMAENPDRNRQRVE